MQRDSAAELQATQRSGIMTRRSLLQQAGCAIVAAAFPGGSCFAAEPVGPVMAKLSAYMSAARERSLPDDVVEKVKEHILDTIAAMISGSELLPGLPSNSPAPMVAIESRQSSGRVSFAGPLKQPSQMECLLTPTRPTIHTPRRSRIPVVQ